MKKLPLFLLGLLAGIIPTAFAVTTFTDVDKSAWYADAVQSLSDKGIIKGYEDGSFQPSNNVNRAELAVTLDRLIDYLQPSNSYTLSKIEVGSEVPTTSDSYVFSSEVYTNYYFLDGDTLYVTAGYGGGCVDHNFRLIWDGTFRDSEHASLYLIQDTNDDTCNNTETDVLKFDLSTLREAYESEFATTMGNLQLRIYNKAENGNSINVEYSFND